MGKGKHPNLYTCLVCSCFCLLCRFCFSFPRMRVLWLERNHMKAAQKKVSKSSFSTTSANICKPLFSTYPSTTNHDMGSTTIILRICVLYTTFSSRAAETHFIFGSLLLGWCFSFCNGFRSGFLATEPTAPMSSSAS